MVDLILLIFVLAVYAAGFWCGARYSTVAAMLGRGKDWLKGILT